MRARLSVLIAQIYVIYDFL